MWNEVPAADQNGIITGYTIAYKSQTENHNGSVPADPEDRQKELTNLKEYVNYNITVFASTEKGDGPASDPVIVVRTDQDSKYFFFDFCGIFTGNLFLVDCIVQSDLRSFVEGRYHLRYI